MYKHIAPNGKVYIGITSRDPKDRWGKDGNRYDNGGAFRHAVKKYGWSNIRHVIIRSGLSEEDAKMAERKLIKRYKARDKRYGYNITPGGDLGPRGVKRSAETREKDRINKLGEKNPMYGVSPSEEIREKIRRANKGKRRSPDTLERMREAQSHRSEETRRKMSEANAERKTPVLCVETGISYDGIRQAARETGLRVSGISNCIYGWSKTCGGFHWKKISDLSEAS